MGLVRTIFDKTGEDAFLNHFVLTLTFPKSSVFSILDSKKEVLKYRIRNFRTPATALSVYDVDYLGERIQRVSGKNESTKEFSFDLRIDKNWSLYQALIVIRKSFYDPQSGYLSTDDYKAGSSKDTDSRFDVAVDPVNELHTKSYKAETGWKFTGCMVKSIAEVEFNHETGEPLYASITCGFLDVIEGGVK